MLEPEHLSADILDSYRLDDDDGDLFAPDELEHDDLPEVGAAATKHTGSSGDILGIDKEIAPTKHTRAPRVKLDENLLLSDRGLAQLRKRLGIDSSSSKKSLGRKAASSSSSSESSKGLRFHGKGHEFEDMARLLAVYQHWLDDLYPKAKFLDALAMVEKLGHKAVVMQARQQWMDEERRQTDDPNGGQDEQDALHDGGIDHGDGDEDDMLDILGGVPTIATTTTATTTTTTPLRGNPFAQTHSGSDKITTTHTSHDPDDFDELDALIREAEADVNAHVGGKATGHTHGIIPSGSSTTDTATAKSTKDVENDFAEEEAAMMEIEGMW